MSGVRVRIVLATLLRRLVQLLREAFVFVARTLLHCCCAAMLTRLLGREETHVGELRGPCLPVAAQRLLA